MDEGETRAWTGRWIEQYDDDPLWRELFHYTATLEIPYCCMVAWVPYGPNVNRISNDIPNSIVSASRLVRMSHQSGGYSCWHIPIEGIPVALSAQGVRKAHFTAMRYWQYAGGYFQDISIWEQGGYSNEGSLRERASYQRHMEPLTTKCLDERRVPLCESFYPFDLTDENLAVVAADPDAVRSELAALQPWADLTKAVLCFVTENSD